MGTHDFRWMGDGVQTMGPDYYVRQCNELRARIAALESQLAPYRWRRVAQEMPESWTNVLAWAPDLAISVVVYYDDTDEPGWFNAWSENEMELTLSHWMPLPDPPKEGE